MASGNQYHQLLRHVAGYSSDSSVLSHDRGHYVKRMERPNIGVVSGRWPGWSSLSRTSNESLESLCQQCYNKKNLARLSIMQGRSDEDGRTTSFIRRVTRHMWVTEVISGTGFYAMTEQAKEKADELRAMLAAELKDSYTVAERVVPRMVCALKVNDTWERVMVKSQCTFNSCILRMDCAEQQEQQLSQEYWHVSLMEVGSLKCVPLLQLALLTREIASVSRQARLYFLRRVHLKDEDSNAEAKTWLKSKIMNNQRLAAELFYRPWGKGKTQAEVVIGNTYMSDALVEAGYAEYTKYHRQDQREKVSAAACCSFQETVSTSSRDSLVSHLPSRGTRADAVQSTMPYLMELIDHLMKKRKEGTYLTFSGSALNLAIKAQSKEMGTHHQGLCEHRHASLNKHQILLRRLRDENPYVHEIRDLKQPLYEQLVEMFDKWKANYKAAQRKSDSAIEIIANIFINFTNKNFGLVKYGHKCRKLEIALGNEVLLQNEGQDLAHMLVPAVATKIMSYIEKLQTSASGFMSAIERPQTLYQFITSSKCITPLSLETLAKDILKGLYHYHERGMAYKHLHPENVLVRNGHASLRPINDQQECRIGEDWPFEGVEVANEDLGKPVDVFNFGLLVLWMACKGADSYYAATMKFYCNVALIKMTMAEDPNQRPLVESMVCTNSLIFRSNSQWCSMPLKDYLKEVFNDKYNAEIDEESCDLPSEMETGESTSESESIFQPRTEEESGNETTESEAPKSEPLSLGSTAGGGKDSPTPNTQVEQA